MCKYSSSYWGKHNTVRVTTCKPATEKKNCIENRKKVERKEKPGRKCYCVWLVKGIFAPVRTTPVTGLWCELLPATCCAKQNKSG